MPRLDPYLIKQEIEKLLLVCPELAEDEQLRADTIEGETDAFKFLSFVVRRIGADKALAAGVAGYIDELRERQTRIERRVDAYRAMAKALMEAAKLKKAELPEATLSVAKGRDKVVVSDPESVPDDLCKVVKAPSLTAIREALEKGLQCNYAAIVKGEPTLNIRIK